jgi:hypothetical protein
MSKQRKPALVAGGEPVRSISVPIARRSATAGSYDPATHSVELVIATESLVKTPGWQLGLIDDYYLEILDCSPDAVDLSQVEADNCPLLDSHAAYSVENQLGKVRETRCEGGQVIGRAYFGQSEDAVTLEADVAAGTAPKVSAGYRRQQAIFDRFEGDIPVYRITKWTLQEASFTPIAADPAAGVRSEQQVIFPCIINEGVRAMRTEGNAAGAANEGSGEGQGNRATEGSGEGQGQRSTEGSGEGQGQRSSDGANGRRHSLFTATAAIAFVDGARAFGADVVTKANDLVTRNQADEISVEAATTQLLALQADAQRAQTGGVSAGGVTATVTADERDKMFRGAQNALVQRAGLTDLFVRAAKQRGENVAEVRRDLDPGEFRGVRNAEMARLFLERAGARVSSWDREVVIGQALTHVDATRALVGNSTSDFANLLENTLHKVLQASYAVTPDTWRRFCGIGSLMDFRPHPRYLLGTFGTLDDLTEDGEFKNKSIPDAAKESITGKTKGNIIAITRQALANDDLDAFGVLGVQFGRAAALTIEVDVYATLAANSGAGPTMNDGNPLFHASHNNISATPAAPSVTSFDDARVGMASQKDPSGNEVLDISPAVWLGPKSLLGSAQTINDALYDPDTANKLQKPNMVRGMFSDMVGTARLTSTPWFAFADPAAGQAALEVAFLNGIQDPYLEQRLGWRVDGTEYKVRLDYGVAGMNYRSAWKNAGA